MKIFRNLGSVKLILKENKLTLRFSFPQAVDLTLASELGNTIRRFIVDNKLARINCISSASDTGSLRIVSEDTDFDNFKTSIDKILKKMLEDKFIDEDDFIIISKVSEGKINYKSPDSNLAGKQNLKEDKGDIDVSKIDKYCWGARRFPKSLSMFGGTLNKLDKGSEEENQGDRNQSKKRKTDNDSNILDAMLVKLLDRDIGNINPKKTVKPSCFICYAWGVEEHEKLVQEVLYKHLMKAGVDAQLDLVNNKPGTSISKYTEQIMLSDVVIVMCSTKLMEKYRKQRNSVVNIELEQIFDKYKQQKSLGTILTVLLDGTEETAKPPFLHGNVHVDFTDARKYPVNFLTLLESIYTVIGIVSTNVIDNIKVMKEQYREMEREIKSSDNEDKLQPFIVQEKKLRLEQKSNASSTLLTRLSSLYSPKKPNQEQEIDQDEGRLIASLK